MKSAQPHSTAMMASPPGGSTAMRGTMIPALTNDWQTERAPTRSSRASMMMTSLDADSVSI